MSECTFKPNTHKKKGERSFKKFLKDQQLFTKKKTDKINEMKQEM